MSQADHGGKTVDTREWYDFVGHLADAVPGMHMGGREATQRLLEMCDLSDSSRVLDVGCGAGHTACLIAEKHGSRVHAIDVSSVMIAKAQARARRLGLTDRADFQIADAYELPFDDDRFDVVILESVLTPLPGDRTRAMHEMLRVLRAGGLLAANETTVDSSAPDEWLALVREHPAMQAHFTPETLRRLFEQSGLHVLEMITASFADSPQVLRDLGPRGLLTFAIGAYPRILLKLLRDSRFRRAAAIDKQMTRQGRRYLGYALLVGQKPAS